MDALRKYEIKMLVRMDKEFSDITYVPTSSLAMQIAELCKKHHNVRFADEAKHGRPYYNYEERIKEFDEASISKSKQIESNPELLKQLQAEMANRKEKERQELEDKRRAEEFCL